MCQIMILIRAHPVNRHRPQSLTGIVALCGLVVFPIAPAAADTAGTPVTVATVQAGTLYEEVPLTGSVSSRRVSRISSRVEGLVAEMLVDEGSAVSASEPMLILDTRLAKIDLARARAQLAEGRARHEESLRQRNEAAELMEKRHIPETRYEATLAEVSISAAVEKRLQADVERQQELLHRHTVRAPFTGVVARKLVEVGQWIKTDTPTFELVDIDVLRVDVPVPQYFFSRIDLGTRVRIKLDALPTRTFDGRVSHKIPVSDESARTFPVKIELQNQDRMIAPGMSARVHFRLHREQADQALVLPRDAIVKRPDGSETVWVVKERNGQSVAVNIDVQSGRSVRDHVEVVAGALRIGDRVVIRGNEILQPGQAVHVTGELERKL